MHRLGLLSDTHDRPHPRVFSLFDGVDAILHAGDVTSPAVLVELEALAPVTGVHGNCCCYELRQRLPATRHVDVAGWRIHLQHNIGNPRAFLDAHPELLRPDDGRPPIVVAGHSHIPMCEAMDGVWFINPGSAGPPRFKSRPSAALLTLDDARSEPHVEFFRLETA